MGALKVGLLALALVAGAGVGGYALGRSSADVERVRATAFRKGAIMGQRVAENNEAIEAEQRRLARSLGGGDLGGGLGSEFP